MGRFRWAWAVPVACLALAGCGGGVGTPAPPVSASRGVARFDVDVASGKVTVTGLDASRAVFSGSAVSFTSSDLLSVGGDAGKRLIRVTARNNSGEAWGSAQVRMVVSDIENASVTRWRENVQVGTLAGSGAPETVDGVGASARFADPYGIAAGQGGAAHGLFVSEFTGQVVRRVEATGLTTTVAGGVSTAAFADGVRSAARFSSPNGIATDAGGNIFVADAGNNRIRRITPSYDVTTIAGTGVGGSADGAGDVATINAPVALACSADGNRIYAATFGTNNIRLLTFTGTRRDLGSSYTVTTVAGSAAAAGFVDGLGTAARFNYPRGLALMTDGTANETLFVADYFNSALRRIDTPAGVARVTTVVGDGVSGLTDGPGSVARLGFVRGVACVRLDDGGFDLYVAQDYRIRVVHFAAGGDPRQKGAYVVNTVAGDSLGSADGNGLTARFGSVGHLVATTKAGGSAMLYVADSGGNRIRTVAVPTGAFQSGGGAGTSAEAVAMVNHDGQVPNRAAYSKVMTEAEGAYQADLQFNIPAGVAGFTFLATIETDSSVVNLPAQGASMVTTIAGTGVPGYRDGNAKAAQFSFPSSVVAVPGSMRSLYRTSSGKPVRAFVVDNAACAVRWVDTEGTVGTFAGGTLGFADGVGALARFAYPTSVALDRQGVLWVTDTENMRVRCILPNGTVYTVAGSGASGSGDGTGALAQFTSPFGITIDAGGVAYVTDYTGHTVRSIQHTAGDVRSPASYTVTTVAGSPGVAGNANGQGLGARFDHPMGIAVAEDGRLYVGDAGNGSVRVLSPVSYSKLFHASNLLTGLFVPNGIAIAPTQDAYVTTRTPTIIRVSPTGAMAVLASGVGFTDTNGGNLGDPYSMAIEESGTLLFCDPAYGALRSVQRTVTSTPL